jgi:hypothetical protein
LTKWWTPWYGDGDPIRVYRRSTMKKSTLDQILDKALEKALATLEDRLAALILEKAGPALKKKIQALFEDEAPAEEAPARARSKTRAAAVEAPAQASAPAEKASKPRARRAKASEAPVPAEDPEAVIEAAAVALAKYRGAFTPKGKPIEEVLTRRLRKTVLYASQLGRSDLKALARGALTLIDSNPRGYAMASWTKLAGDLGLPVPTGEGSGE